MTKVGISGKVVGEQYFAQVEQLLRSGSDLPMRNGDLDMTAIASLAGVPRQSLYKNPAIRAALEEARPLVKPTEAPVRTEATDSKIVSSAVEDGKAIREQHLERRVHRLEQQNAALTAENYELRKQVKQLRLQMGRQDMVIETARRVVSTE